jgi:hypothetical protein
LDGPTDGREEPWAMTDALRVQAGLSGGVAALHPSLP